MKATLVKKQANWYNLYQNDIGIGSTHAELQGYKLSLKNCQAVERGYDLDELAKIEYPICEVWNDEEALIRELAFKKGFQKAIELMGDKKFSEEDMRNAYLEGANQALDFNPDSVIDENKYIQSLQQTEWDVEIEMQKVPAKMPGVMVFTKAPKLDENGWLILKRI